MAAAHEAGAPVILQASAGARKYAGEAFIKHLILAAIDEMLQSVTYVWARPPGPAPAPIFQERIALLSRFHSLPPPQTPGRLQADTALGRLIVQDMPERNLLLEAYAARK